MKRLLLLAAVSATILALAPVTQADAAINCAAPSVLNNGYRAVARCLNQRADNQLSMIVGLQARVHALEASETVAGLSSRVDALDTRVDGLASRMTTAEGRLNSQDTRVDGLASRMTTAEGRLDSQASINTAQAQKFGCLTSGPPVYRWYKQLYTGSGWTYESWFDAVGGYSDDNANMLAGPIYLVRDACGGSTF